MTPKLKMGMVGGGRDAFIGMVHRTAAQLDGQANFVAGALSSTPDKALASGRDLGLDDRRNYPTWEKMLQGELALSEGERIDFVSIATPNHLHFPVARAFAEAGFNVVCDKPLVHTVEQAEELVAIVKRTGIVFAVTYNYSGYAMVKQARHMIQSGELGELRKIIVEYNQGWLATKLEDTGLKQADWRTDPARAGAGGAIGDIGSHAEHLVSYVTGLEIESICADLTAFVPGRALDDDANLLLRFAPLSGGDGAPAKGIFTASQVCIGRENDLALRVWGTRGGLQWRQEDPNHLVFSPLGEADRVLRRANDYLCDDAKKASRIPSGHPEAYFEAFANVYSSTFAAMRAGAGTKRNGAAFDYPDITAGARGVRFIHRTVESSRSDVKWTALRV